MEFSSKKYSTATTVAGLFSSGPKLRSPNTESGKICDEAESGEQTERIGVPLSTGYTVNRIE